VIYARAPSPRLRPRSTVGVIPLSMSIRVLVSVIEGNHRLLVCRRPLHKRHGGSGSSRRGSVRAPVSGVPGRAHGRLSGTELALGGVPEDRALGGAGHRPDAGGVFPQGQTVQ
jgi:hypothetical protein